MSFNNGGVFGRGHAVDLVLGDLDNVGAGAEGGGGAV